MIAEKIYPFVLNINGEIGFCENKPYKSFICLKIL